MRIFKNGNILLILFIIVNINYSLAQRTPIVSGYFQNQYLFNPAQTGTNQTKAVDLGFRNSFNNQNNGTSQQFIHAMYGFGRNGVGAGLFSTNQGVMNQAKVNLDYAFHLPLGDLNNVLSMGTGVSFIREQIDMDKIVGNPNDPLVSDYNENGNGLDINLGVAYTAGNINVSFAANNILKNNTKYIINNTPAYYASVSYSIRSQDISIAPLIAYRSLLNMDDVVDFGANVGISNLFNVYALYHTSNNVSVGLNTSYKKFTINVGYYNETSQVIKPYGQEFDLGLRYAW
jgi:type IX secretion system PorP/SprF family membrane protein